MSEEIKSYNLDDVQEYFTFVIKGKTYRFQYMTTEEIESLAKLKDGKESMEFFYKFITPIDEGAPDFKIAANDFTIPNWKAFRNMIETEMKVE